MADLNPMSGAGPGWGPDPDVWHGVWVAEGSAAMAAFKAAHADWIAIPATFVPTPKPVVARMSRLRPRGSGTRPRDGVGQLRPASRWAGMPPSGDDMPSAEEFLAVLRSSRQPGAAFVPPGEIKGFQSFTPGGRGAFALETSLETVRREIARGENVILDLSSLSRNDSLLLRDAIRREGLLDHVLFWP